MNKRVMMTDERLERIARLCLAEYYLRGAGWRERVAVMEGRSIGTFREWVREARRRGFLAEGGRGTSHVEPGPRLLPAPKKGRASEDNR